MTFILEKKIKIKNCFNLAANHYDEHANIQKYALLKLMTLYKDALNQSQLILDLGCATDPGRDKHITYIPNATIVSIDIAHKMLLTAQRNWGKNNYICADFDHLPFADQSFDGIFSSMALQWSLNLSTSLIEWQRVLKPKGQIALCLMGKKSLNELNQCWNKIDVSTHQHLFYGYENLLEIFSAHGFKINDAKIINKKNYYDDIFTLLHSFKQVGAHYNIHATSKKVLTKACIEKLKTNYPSVNGLLPLTYELYFFLLEKL